MSFLKFNDYSNLITEQENSDAVSQEFTSAGTSQNQVANLFKNVPWEAGTTNFDIGAGKYYHKAQEVLNNLGVNYLMYDPYNIPQDINDKSLAQAQSEKVDTVSCANVLNVIKEQQYREDIYKLALSVLKEGGVAYFSVYVGDKSNVGKMSKKDCWQNNRTADQYIDEMRPYFKNIKKKGNILICFN